MVREPEPGSVSATATAAKVTEVTRVTETVLPTRHGVFRVTGYRDGDGTEHVALARGLDAPTDGRSRTVGRAPLVRVHSECLTGDAFGSWRCDCGDQLDAALSAVAAEGFGVVVYVRGHEGRGIGLLAKLRAYALQDLGVDTVDANTALGLPVDARRYDQAAGILRDLGITSVRLLSGNPAKEEALAALGITVVERHAPPVAQRPENADYLTTKRERMRHDAAPRGQAWDSLLAGEVPAVSGPGTDGDLVHRYGRLASSRGNLTVGCVRQSLDGFALPLSPADPTAGDEVSGSVVHVRRLQALVDAVVVDARTFSERGSVLGVGAVPGRSPLRVVLDPEAALGPEEWAAADGAPTLWLVPPGAAAPHAVDLPGSVDLVRPPAWCPADVLELLRARGRARILVEGAAVSAFLEAGLLDTLQLLTAPVLLGGGEPGIRFTGAAVRDAPARQFLLDRDTCTELDLPSRR